MKNRRYGRFKIKMAYMDLYSEFIAKAFARMDFVATRCEFNYASNQFEYEGLSRVFERIEGGESPPEYAIEYDIRDDSILFTKTDGSIASSLELVGKKPGLLWMSQLANEKL